jgi:hypothetical protein
MGTTEFKPVPYAIHAETATDINDADADPTNELQDLELSGNELALSEDATPVDLSGYLDNTDNQTLAGVLSQGNDAGSASITNLADPINNADAATKGYVDSYVNSHAFSNYQIVDQHVSTHLNPAVFAEAVAGCPAGTMPIGGGVNLTSVHRDIIVAKSYASGSSWTASVLNTGSESAYVAFSVQAICAKVD